MDTAAMQNTDEIQRKHTVFMYESLNVGHLFGSETAVVVVRGQLGVGIVSYF